MSVDGIEFCLVVFHGITWYYMVFQSVLWHASELLRCASSQSKHLIVQGRSGALRQWHFCIVIRPVVQGPLVSDFLHRDLPCCVDDDDDDNVLSWKVRRLEGKMVGNFPTELSAAGMKQGARSVPFRSWPTRQSTLALFYKNRLCCRYITMIYLYAVVFTALVFTVCGGF